MRDDICKDLIRHDWEDVKACFEKLGEPYKKRAQVEADQRAKKTPTPDDSTTQPAAAFNSGIWIYNETMAAVRVIERTLNYELPYDQALPDIVDFYRKTRVVIDIVSEASPSYVKLGLAIDNLAADLDALKQPNSPRLAYLAISRYLEFAAYGFSEIEKQASSWEMVVPGLMIKKLRKEIADLRGDPGAAVYEKDKDYQKSVIGAIALAQAAAHSVTGCVDHKLARETYEHLRIVLHEVRSIYCRILCLARNFGVGVQHGVADNIRIAIIEVARYLELAFRTFESIRVNEEDCVAELRVAWVAISTQVATLQIEITRWSSLQLSQVSTNWQSSITALTSYTQEATTQIALLQGTRTYSDRKTAARINELTNLVDDCVKQLYCTFERHQDFRIEVFYGFWEWLIEGRCGLACFYREERDEQGSREEQLAKFFQLFDFLKNSSAAQAGGGTVLPQPSSSPSPVTASFATAATLTPASLTTLPPQLPDYWVTAQTLIASLKTISPRLSSDTAEKWTTQAQTEIEFLKRGPVASNIPTDILLSRSQQGWGTLFGRLSVIVAIEKDAATGQKGSMLDKFAADLASLNQKMLKAFGQPVPTPVSAAARGGASS
jgi:hypothetical protein